MTAPGRPPLAVRPESPGCGTCSTTQRTAFSNGCQVTGTRGLPDALLTGVRVTLVKTLPKGDIVRIMPLPKLCQTAKSPPGCYTAWYRTILTATP